MRTSAINDPEVPVGYRDFSGITLDQVPCNPYPKEVFPIKLHRILSSEQFSHLIAWLPHGRAWKVIDRDRFAFEVLPNFFGHNKWTSFRRQANDWGFTRIPWGSGPASGAYYHEVNVYGLCICEIVNIHQLDCTLMSSASY